MTPVPDIHLAPQIDRDDLMARLGRVLDPELDESVLTLGFVESVAGDDAGNVTVCLRLPTYWCAANFSYLMASDVQRELSELEGVRSVTVKLREHFASREVEEGSVSAMTFGAAFPNSGPDTLEETRQIFLRKGYFSRQEHLLRELKRNGLSVEHMAVLRVGDIEASQVDPRVASRYLERREELELDCSPQAPLIVALNGQKIPPTDMETYYIRARTTRLAMQANGSLCSAMLQSRNANWTPETF